MGAVGNDVAGRFDPSTCPDLYVDVARPLGAVMLRLSRLVVALVTLLALWPALASAQTKAGVVTTLQGSATAARTALPQPVALKFKDDVFQNDRIVTGDQSIVRMLLGGKAVVTVRERSSLTITEVPGKSTIDLDVGKIAVAVAKEKLRPGESIEVKTPNAVAAVRGTVFITEVIRATASADAAQLGVVTNFYGFVGQVFLNFLSGQAFTLGPNGFAGALGGNLANFRPMTQAEQQTAPAGLTTEKKEDVKIQCPCAKGEECKCGPKCECPHCRAKKEKKDEAKKS